MTKKMTNENRGFTTMFLQGFSLLTTLVRVAREQNE